MKPGGVLFIFSFLALAQCQPATPKPSVTLGTIVRVDMNPGLAREQANATMENFANETAERLQTLGLTHASQNVAAIGQMLSGAQEASIALDRARVCGLLDTVRIEIGNQFRQTNRQEQMERSHLEDVFMRVETLEREINCRQNQ